MRKRRPERAIAVVAICRDAYRMAQWPLDEPTIASWRLKPREAGPMQRSFEKEDVMLSRHPLRDGVVAGLLGAASVAAWFFFLDLVAGRPFFTPAVLGAAVLQLFGGEFGGRGLAFHVVVYTVLHVAAFVALGIVAAGASNAMERTPRALNGFLALFVVLELAYLGAVRLAAASELFGTYAWWQFGVANLIAASLMGRYIWHTHHPKAFWQLRTLHEKT
jgi:hypothetical protein